MTDSIAAEAESRLHESSYSELHSIRCTFHLGILRLHGVVPSFYVRQLAQDLIEDLKGIQIVDNQLVIVRDQPTPVAG